MDIFQIIPAPKLHQMLSSLEIDDLLSVSLVSPAWRRFALPESIWKAKCEEMGVVPRPIKGVDSDDILFWKFQYFQYHRFCSRLLKSKPVEKFEIELPCKPIVRMEICSDCLILSNSATFFVVSLRKKKILWSLPEGEKVGTISVCGLSKGRVVVSSRSSLKLCDLYTGQVDWIRYGDFDGYKIAVSGDMFVAYCQAFRVFGFHVKPHEIKCLYKQCFQNFHRVCMDDPKLNVLYGDSGLVLYDRLTGEFISEMEINGIINVKIDPVMDIATVCSSVSSTIAYKWSTLEPIAMVDLLPFELRFPLVRNPETGIVEMERRKEKFHLNGIRHKWFYGKRLLVTSADDSLNLQKIWDQKTGLWLSDLKGSGKPTTHLKLTSTVNHDFHIFNSTPNANKHILHVHRYSSLDDTKDYQEFVAMHSTV